MRKSLVAVFLLLVSEGCGCQTVGPGEVGVQVDWGKVTPRAFSSGFYTTAPGEDILVMNTRLQVLEEADIPCRSKDNGSVKVDVTLQYALVAASAPRVYAELGNDYRGLVLLPALRSATRDAVSQVNAMEAAQARETIETAIQNRVEAKVRDLLKEKHLPETAISISGIQLRNVELPQSMTQSIERIQQQYNARLEREQALQTAQAEAARAVAEAEGRNRVQLLNAQGEAERRRIRGESEAAYYRAIGSSLTNNMVELQRIQMQGSVQAAPGTRTIILGAPSSSPFVMNLGAGSGQ